MLMCRWVSRRAGRHGGQKRATCPLELQLQAAANCLVWLLGTKVRLTLLTPEGLSSSSNLTFVGPFPTPSLRAALGHCV